MVIYPKLELMKTHYFPKIHNLSIIETCQSGLLISVYKFQLFQGRLLQLFYNLY